jgi:hypothetical protein
MRGGKTLREVDRVDVCDFVVVFVEPGHKLGGGAD